MSALRRTWSLIDGPLTASVLLIIGLGLVNLYSATRVAPKGMFSSQLMWIAIGLLLLGGVAALDQQLLKRLAWPGYLGVTALLGAVLVVGKVVNGSRRWFGWGSFGIQPSELMKLSLILLGAHLFSSDPKDMSLRPWRYALKWHALWIVPALLILKQPDLGTALLCGLLALSVFVLVPLPPRLKGWVATVGLSGAFLIVRFGLKEYQKKRLLTFLHPELDPTGTGYHARQALFAIGSGRLTGKGYLRGTQNHLQFLPEHWTDFPFAVWAEEWGLLGCLGLLACFLFLILWTLHIAAACRDRFGRYLVLGCAALLFWHVSINIAMVIGMAPVVGVTLPLVSYGGSSVLTVMAALGLIYNVSARRYQY